MDMKNLKDDLFKYRLRGEEKRWWERLGSWINTIIMVEKRDENFYDWDGNRLKVYTLISRDVFKKYLLASLVYLAQFKSGSGLCLEEFCKENFLKPEGVISLVDIIKVCKTLFSYGKL